MTKAKHLTADQVKELKKVIRTGEPIASISERLYSQYGRDEQSFRMTLYGLARRTYKIAEWNGPKRRTLNPTKKQKRQAQQMQLAFNPSTTITPRIEKYPDHIRFYF